MKNRIICIAKIVKMFILYYIYLIPHNSERCLLSSINHILHPVIEFTTIPYTFFKVLLFYKKENTSQQTMCILHS